MTVRTVREETVGMIETLSGFWNEILLLRCISLLKNHLILKNSTI